MKIIYTLPAVVLTATPALAAGKGFNLGNTDFVVAIAFFLFIGVLIYFKVPGMIAGLLDKRAEGIQSELDEARALREEAQSILAGYERKQKEVAEQAEKIVANAKAEAQAAADQAKEDIKASAVKEVRDTAASVAVAAASDVIAKGITAKDAGSLIDAAIADVGEKLH
jgi:F-type H+-transporting ATPase subunit b